MSAVLLFTLRRGPAIIACVSADQGPLIRLTEAARRRLSQAPAGLPLFFLAMAFMAVASGIFDSVYNNYLDDTFHISATTRGQLEFPRELPGLLTAAMIGLFFFVADTGLGAMAAAAVALGMAGLALFGQQPWQWWPMVAATFVWSLGNHLIMPVRDSVALSLARNNQPGRRLGQLGAVATFATIGGFAVVYVGMRILDSNYAAIFAVGALSSGLAVIAWLAVPRLSPQPKRRRVVFKRHYWLFYVLCLLFGARKQLFITFGPWVLVRVFRRRPYVFAQLHTVGALIGIFFQPLLGNLIDRVGERIILMADAVLLIGVCLGYGFAHRLEHAALALAVVYICYVADQVLFAVGMARTTYLSKIVDRPEDLTPSLSLGVSINHVVSMSLPTLGGIVWDRFGHSWVFLGAAGIALLTLIFASLVRTETAERSRT